MNEIKENANITIYDNMGKPLRQIQVPAHTDIVPIHLKKGFYLLRIAIGHDTKIIKLTL